MRLMASLVGLTIIACTAATAAEVPVSDPASGEALSAGARAVGVPVSDPASGKALSAGEALISGGARAIGVPVSDPGDHVDASGKPVGR